MSDTRGGDAFIWATPNPVPFGADPGTTTIEWSTGDGSPGWVFLRHDDGEETLFSHQPVGLQEAAWIQPEMAYRFTLYGDEERAGKLDAVTVTMGSPTRELLLDLALVAAVVVVAATAIAALIRVFSLVSRTRSS